MARTARRSIPGLPHQVTTRGNNRRRIFSYPRDYRHFLRLVEEALGRTNCHLHQITLMSNHVHMILLPDRAEDLALFMKICCQKYAQYRNRTKGCTGKLFEQRFYSEPIDQDEYMSVATVYNDTNAYRAGMVAAPHEHRWSTCALHEARPGFSEIPEAIWTPSTWYLALGGDSASRARVYRHLVENYLATKGPSRAAAAPAEAERLSSTPYTRRIKRPDGSSAE